VNYTKGELRKAGLRVETDKVFIADCNQSDNLNEMDANAHLISAAPDMYEACKKTLLLLQYITTGDFEIGKDKPVRDLLEKVIAKAEGKEVK